MSDKWTATSESYAKERRVYTAKDHNSKIKDLADIVGLEVKYFRYWGKVLRWGTYTKIARRNSGGKVKATKIRVKYPHTVSVPNVWVAVDALRGGSWYYDIPLVNPGGSIGMFLGTDLFTYGMKVEKFRTIKGLMAFLKNPQKRKNIWGMVIFAHGHEYGYVGKYKDKDQIFQFHIIDELRKNRYRIARAYLMQCFSGYEGKSVFWLESKTVADVKKFLFRNFVDFKNEKIEKLEGEEKSIYRITFDVNWHIEWGSVVATEPFTYKKMNILMIDFDIFDW